MDDILNSLCMSWRNSSILLLQKICFTFTGSLLGDGYLHMVGDVDSLFRVCLVLYHGLLLILA